MDFLRDKRDKNNRLVQLKMIEKIKWFAAILIDSGFINLKDGHNGYKRWLACFVAKKA